MPHGEDYQRRFEHALDGVPDWGRGAPDPCLHRRELLYSAGAWIFRCTCGFVSRKYDTQLEAETRPCPIETELRESAERERKLYRVAEE